MRKVLILGGNTLAAATLAATLGASGERVVMPSRRLELEPGYDMNDLIDLESKAERKKDRKARMKELQAKAFAS